ncbi:hypothetical protein [Pseudomonas benzenivorans]|uniref:Uncharacterized protein n=1 Tax=Pseudomonas benzenivorans TaxID=556533 RepID=A0ABY5H107_9PSED|nr:hypothetical protein [Pseudomonas benzenivorans]UTW05940.1 hypothetical protein KDW96_12135 [Pseudomonas benzenivorans]
MSLPVLTYRCTSCSFMRLGSITWGRGYYLAGESRLPMSSAAGWCHSCDDLRAIEVLPSADAEVKLQDELADLQSRLRVMDTSPPPRKRWWQFKTPKDSARPFLESQLEAAKARLSDYQRLRQALAARNTHPRCLNCGAEDCLRFPPYEVDYFDTAAPPVRIGFSHPGCGGELTAACEGTRLAMNLTGQAYDLEGERLPEYSA